jgi:hypothetical protein
MKPPAAFAEAPRFSARERRAPVLGKRALRDSRRVKGPSERFRPNAFTIESSGLSCYRLARAAWASHMA